MCRWTSVPAFLRTVMPSSSGVKHSSSQTARPFVLSKRLESLNPSPRRHIPEDLNYQPAPETQTESASMAEIFVQGGSNMTGTDCGLFIHK